MADNSAFALIAVIIIVALVMTPQIITVVGDLIDKGWELWQDAWNQIAGQDGAGSGQAGINLKVYDTEGNVYKLETEPSKFAPLMIPIPDGGGQPPPQLQKVEADVVVTPQYEGTMESYTATWTFSVYITDASGVIIHEFGSWDKDTSGGAGSWDSGHAMFWIANQNPLFSKQTVQANEIENALSGEGTGHYQLRFKLSVTLTVDFEDGGSDMESGETIAFFAFDWDEPQGEITSLSVHVDANPL